MLDHETESSERQRNLMKNKKNPYSIEKPRNYKAKYSKNKSGGGEVTESGENGRSHDYESDEYLNDKLSGAAVLKSTFLVLFWLQLIVIFLTR